MLFKGFKKKPKKSKIRIIITILVLLILTGVVLYEVFKPDPLPEYSTVSVESGSINHSYITTGNVESNNKTEFKIIDGTKVSAVYVKVGDKVTKGQLLASFDTSSLSSKLSSLKAEYDEANAKYTESKATVSSSKAQVISLNKQISSLEKEIASLEKQVEALKAQEAAANTVTGPVTYTGTQYTPEQISAMSQQILANGGTQEQVNTMIAALNAIEGTSNMTDEQIAASLNNTSAAKSLKLSQDKAQLTALQTQVSVYELQSDDTIANAYKSAADIKQAEYIEMKDTVAILSKGWTAEGDGIVTEVNITAGEVYASSDNKKEKTTDYSDILNMIGGASSSSTDITSILSGLLSSSQGSNDIGMVAQNYDEFIATFTVGKYDLLSLSVGQTATISTLGSNYEGEVIYVSATASESSSFDISSITSTLTGGSSASSSAVVKVKIKNPDKKIIIGFDVDIAVNIEKIDNVLILPVEALRFENGEKYVFVYNEDDKTVSKKDVTLGISEDTKYQVLAGIEAGDIVVKNPLSALEDGNKIAIKK